MAGGTLRKIQPAHKSDKLTVREARNAWLKVEREAASAESAPEAKEAEYGTARSRRARKKKKDA